MLLSSCAAPAAPGPGAPTPPAAPIAPTTEAGPIRIGFGGFDPERAAYQPAIDAFNAANPDIQVEFVSLESLLSDGDMSDMARRVAQAADTFTSMLTGPEAADSGYLADLRPLMEADAAFARDDFQAGALPPGRLLVLPTTISVPTLTYDRARWAAAGLEAPAPGWSWDDLLAAAEHLTLREGDHDQVRSPGLDDGRGGMLVLQGLLTEAGVSLTPSASGAVDLTQPAVAEAVTRVADLLDRGVIARSSPGGDPSAERAAMWVGGELAGMVSAVESGSGAAIEMAPQPEDLGDAALPPLPRELAISPRGYSISIGAAQPEAAWRWLSYLSTQTISFGGGIMIFGAGYDIPARRSMADTSGFWAGLPPERAAALQASLARADSLPPAADQAVRASLNNAIEQVVAGASADQALADASAALTQQQIDQAANPTATPVAIQVQLPEPVVIPEGATTIRFSSFGQDPAAMRTIAEQFNAQGNGVYVELVPPNFGAGEISLPSMTAGLDCFGWHRPPTPEERSALLDLQPLLDAVAPGEAAPMRDDYPEALMSPFRADGHLYGLPYAVSLRALNYNRGAFAAAGIEPPSADWELADLLDAAGRLTEKDGPDPRYGYAIQGDPASDLLAFLLWQGAAPFTSGPGRAPRFTDPQVTQALREYIGLLRDYSPHTSIDGYRQSGSFAGARAFGMTQGGHIGMWFSSGFEGIIVSVEVGRSEGAAPPDLAIAPPPIGQRPLTDADISSSSLMIAAGSAHPDACWQWLSFLSRQESGLGQQFPARTSVATSDAFLRQARPGAVELYAAYAEALAQPLAAAERYVGVDPFWLLQAVDRALQGGDLERELESAQSTTELYLACVAGGDEPSACATQADPEYAGFGPLQE
jgi:ABC-type glycerol-3-phosphate transport system substrate-binding protein